MDHTNADRIGRVPAPGRGEAADGQIQATATRERLESLELNPRLMRLSGEQLAGYVARAIDAAQEEARADEPSTQPDAGLPTDPKAVTADPKVVTTRPSQGHGQAADGLIHAVAAAPDGRLTRLEIGDGAMRMASHELAERILLAVNTALAELRATLRRRVDARHSEAHVRPPDATSKMHAGRAEEP